MTHQPRLALTIADKLDAFLAQTALRGLRVKALRLSPDEFRELHRDPDATAYGDGLYAGIRLRVVQRVGPSPWTKRSYYDGTERVPLTAGTAAFMSRRKTD